MAPESGRAHWFYSKHAGKSFIRALHMIFLPSVVLDPFCSIHLSQLGHLSRSVNISNFLVGPVTPVLICHLLSLLRNYILKHFK